MTGSCDCPGCGRPHPVGQGLCEQCGASLEWRPAPRRTRRGRGSIYAVAAAGIAAGWLAHSRPSARPVVSAAPRMDVVLAIDSTGSMDDEIEVVQRDVRSMLAAVPPSVRFGLVSYKDHGDDYVTRAQPLTSDAASIVQAVEGLHASGGGDTPEAVDEAVEEMNWDLDPHTRRMLVLIGDAGPHQQCRYDWREEARIAHRRHITIDCWGCSGIEQSGESEFREIATIADGQFNYLTYRQQLSQGASVLFQGGASYTVRSASADAAWTSGADRVARNFGSDVVRNQGKPVSPPSGPGRLDNNLGRALTDQVKAEADPRH